MSKNKLDISVRIDKLNNNENNNVKAFVSANIAKSFAIHGIKVIQSQKDCLYQCHKVVIKILVVR